MLKKLTTFLKARRKAIAGLAVPIIVYEAARHGFNLTTDQAAILATILTGGAVYGTPNTPAPPP